MLGAQAFDLVAKSVFPGESPAIAFSVAVVAKEVDCERLSVARDEIARALEVLDFHRRRFM